MLEVAQQATRWCCTSSLLAFAWVALAGCDRECRPGTAGRTRAALVPSGQPVHCENRRTFDFEGRRVRLTHVEYGEEMDCPSGCFSAHVCALEDGGEILLYYAAWNLEQERPLTVDDECPGLEGSETWPDCEPSGRMHALNQDKEFIRWASAQVGSGPFRHCVNRFFY